MRFKYLFGDPVLVSFRIVDHTRFVNVLAGNAEAGSSSFTVPVRNSFRTTVPGDLAPLLRRVVLGDGPLATELAEEIAVGIGGEPVAGQSCVQPMSKRQGERMSFGLITVMRSKSRCAPIADHALAIEATGKIY